MRELGAIFAGGSAGALLRVLVAEALPHEPGSWPWATLLVNVAGAFALGWIVAAERHRALLGVGLCGALTTFSAFQLELLDLIDDDRTGLAAAYAAVSLAAGMAAVALGRRAA